MFEKTERNYIDDSEWDALTDTYRPSNYYSDCLDMPEDLRD